VSCRKYENRTIRAEGHRLRTHVGQLDRATGRRQDLVDGRKTWFGLAKPTVLDRDVYSGRTAGPVRIRIGKKQRRQHATRSPAQPRAVKTGQWIASAHNSNETGAVANAFSDVTGWLLIECLSRSSISPPLFSAYLRPRPFFVCSSTLSYVSGLVDEMPGLIRYSLYAPWIFPPLYLVF